MLNVDGTLQVQINANGKAGGITMAGTMAPGSSHYVWIKNHTGTLDISGVTYGDIWYFFLYDSNIGSTLTLSGEIYLVKLIGVTGLTILVFDDFWPDTMTATGLGLTTLTITATAFTGGGAVVCDLSFNALNDASINGAGGILAFFAAHAPAVGCALNISAGTNAPVTMETPAPTTFDLTLPAASAFAASGDGDWVDLPGLALVSIWFNVSGGNTAPGGHDALEIYVYLGDDASAVAAAVAADISGYGYGSTQTEGALNVTLVSNSSAHPGATSGPATLANLVLGTIGNSYIDTILLANPSSTVTHN
ncbi:MAG: hypothetical protein ABJF10_24535 [Chthoniobacter sp.]